MAQPVAKGSQETVGHVQCTSEPYSCEACPLHGTWKFSCRSLKVRTCTLEVLPSELAAQLFSSDSRSYMNPHLLPAVAWSGNGEPSSEPTWRCSLQVSPSLCFLCGASADGRTGSRRQETQWYQGVVWMCRGYLCRERVRFSTGYYIHGTKYTYPPSVAHHAEAAERNPRISVSLHSRAVPPCYSSARRHLY